MLNARRIHGMDGAWDQTTVMFWLLFRWFVEFLGRRHFKRPRTTNYTGSGKRARWESASEGPFDDLP
jgi:hypothetical protein